jgi:hypothetical protein
MPSFTFFDSFTTAQTLATGEFGFIADTGSLVVNGDDAIDVTGTVAVAVNGRLSGGDNAVDFFDGVFALAVGATGRITAPTDDAILAEDLDQSFVSNAGRIRSGEDALDLRGGGPITILNTGTLFGRSDGIVTESIGSETRIENRGTITGDDGGGIDHLGGDSLLVNRGTIEGAEYGFQTADVADGEPAGEDDVRNFGSIEGGVFLFAAGDFVENRGEIDLIELGGGDDVYFGRGTGSAGNVDGGGGRDALVSSRADDTFIGGGAGDSFIFLRRGGADRIEDFGGQDVIDLSIFGFSRFAEVRSLIDDRPNGSLIDLSDDGLTILLTGVDKADLRASDFILEPMVM